MRKFSLLFTVFALVVSGSTASAGQGKGPPTFTKDVAPIFYENCVTCHRPNNIAPMALLEYADARPWARSTQIRESGGLSRSECDPPCSRLGTQWSESLCGRPLRNGLRTGWQESP